MGLGYGSLAGPCKRVINLAGCIKETAFCKVVSSMERVNVVCRLILYRQCDTSVTYMILEVDTVVKYQYI
jgi:hypothetical protein